MSSTARGPAVVVVTISELVGMGTIVGAPPKKSHGRYGEYDTREGSRGGCCWYILRSHGV